MTLSRVSRGAASAAASAAVCALLRTTDACPTAKYAKARKNSAATATM